MTNRLLGALAAACTLAIAGCSSNSDSGTGGTGGTGGTITVTAGAGTTPSYSWTGGDVMTVTVVRTSAPTMPVWGVATPGTDGIASPTTHGATPAGAVQTFGTETTLTSGVEYRVSVAKIDGQTFGFVDFTP